MNRPQDYPYCIPHPPLIFEVPDDILSYIFLINASSRDLRSAERAFATISSSYVCRTWRSVALGYPTLWSHIINYNEDSFKRIDELIRRSNPSLLDFGSPLRLIHVSEDRLQVLELVLNQSSRLRAFYLETSIPGWELVCSRFLGNPAPNLESFNFCLQDSECTLSAPLFDGRAPNLRHFHLHRCAVDFSSPVLGFLTVLYVRQINAAPTADAWLQLLDKMPFLHWLTIIDAISHSVTQTELPVIHLNYLKQLSVEAGLRASVALIQHLITPSHCGLRLRCSGVYMGPEQQALWAVIDKRLDYWEKDRPVRKFRAIQDEGSITFGNRENMSGPWEYSETEELEYGRVLPSEPLLEVLLHSDGSDSAILLFISLSRLFERTFRTTACLTLWTDHEEEASGTELFRPLADCFPALVNLKILDLAYDSPSFIFPLLQRTFSPGSVLLPALQTIFFINVSFRRNSASLARVAAFLRWRKEQGFPIQKIHIYESQIDRDYTLSHFEGVEVEIDYTVDTDPDTDEEEGGN